MVVEQALAAAEQDRIDQQTQLVDQVRGQQLMRQVAAALGQQVGAVAALELEHRDSEKGGADPATRFLLSGAQSF